MDKDKIERKLNTEIELFKVYSFFVAGLIAGISSIIISKTYKDEYVEYLLWGGGGALVVFVIAVVYSYIRIKILTKK